MYQKIFQRFYAMMAKQGDNDRSSTPWMSAWVEKVSNSSGISPTLVDAETTLLHHYPGLQRGVPRPVSGTKRGNQGAEKASRPVKKAAKSNDELEEAPEAIVRRKFAEGKLTQCTVALLKDFLKAIHHPISSKDTKKASLIEEVTKVLQDAST